MLEFKPTNLKLKKDTFRHLTLKERQRGSENFFHVIILFSATNLQNFFQDIMLFSATKFTNSLRYKLSKVKDKWKTSDKTDAVSENNIFSSS